MTSYVLVYPYPDTPPPSTGAGGIARPSWLPASLGVQIIEQSSISLGILQPGLPQVHDRNRTKLAAAAAAAFSIHHLQVFCRYRVALREKVDGWFDTNLFSW